MDAKSLKVVQENRDYTMFSWSVQGACESDSHETRPGRLVLGR